MPTETKINGGVMPWETRIDGGVRIRTIRHDEALEPDVNRRFESYVLNGGGAGESHYAPTEQRASVNHSSLVIKHLR